MPDGLVKGDVFTIDASYEINPEPVRMPKVGDEIPIMMGDELYANTVVTVSRPNFLQLTVTKPVSSETP